ncbi:inositol polyphosphate multikinase beta-like [Amaranthus tricolor]|uniref:inositol polyphosphate multikinase beta-like n=1 Tax=Amaranthus tricolor TaxID=29722 RepID=UPI002584BAC6|nr:inositol polyphosphate multikinase beta-like [Amaranthus tricolor]XP_057534181.1 inositol polyphosphate multikinase beta-like [Amaranthus tricolor]XP_057534182.1 inositol polyphosphate multikinase beta-like [Amaranthus tricolor]
MLKIPDHQVAGHQALRGQLGPQIDESGRFYKPLQQDERGSRELAFYEALNSSSKVKKQILGFFPAFYGTQILEASDGSGLHPHLVLHDVVSGYVKPCIMDIKIGSRTWYPQASEDYVAKCLRKDRGSTSVPLGFRISGLQIYQGEKPGYWKPDKKQIQKYTVQDVRPVLNKFVSSIPSSSSDCDPDRALAHDVYGGLSGILRQLKELKSWFETQTDYHFYSCSILLIYDGESETKGGNPQSTIKLIDFAHVFDGDGVIDHNFLGGLCSLIKFIAESSTPPSTKPARMNGLDS